MPTVHTRYVTWISRGRRHHGSAAQDIVTPLNTAASDGGAYQAWASPEITWSDAQGEHTADFAFWSVTGAADGASIAAAPSLSVPVGSGDVNATAWYLPTGGGGGNGGPGVYIDAFDVNQGTFVDDDFVDVPSDPMLTAAANEDGFVPTASAEQIEAFASIHLVPFLDWRVVAGAETVSGRELDAAAGSVAVAFAFFQTPAGAGLRPPRQFVAGTWVSWGVTVDGGGPTGAGPVPPWNPYVRALVAGLALADTAQLVDAPLRSSVLRLAARQVMGAASAMSEKLKEGSVAVGALLATDEADTDPGRTAKR